MKKPAIKRVKRDRCGLYLARYDDDTHVRVITIPTKWGIVGVSGVDRPDKQSTVLSFVHNGRGYTMGCDEYLAGYAVTRLARKFAREVAEMGGK